MRYEFEEIEDGASGAGSVASVLMGAVAGFAAGMFLAQRMGGFGGLLNSVRSAAGAAAEGFESRTPLVADDYADFDEYEDDELEDAGDEEASELEERVLEAFRNDPILCERAVDIGGIGEDTIELAGWVNTDEEAEHAVTLARGVPGVGNVVNRIAIGDEEERIRDHSTRFAAGDDALTGARWEGNTVGTGRRRQGTSDDIDRHADPKTNLEERWTSAEVELAQAADDTTGIAERRTREKKAIKGDRTGGSPIAPTGVPKGDHVAEPTKAPQS